MTKLSILGLCLAVLGGCASYPPVRYATDGTYQVTARGQILPAPSSGESVLEVPQIPRDHEEYIRPDVLAQFKKKLGKIQADQTQMHKEQHRSENQYRTMQNIMLGTAPEQHGQNTDASDDGKPEGNPARAYYLTPKEWGAQSARAERIVHAVAFNQPTKKQIDERTRQLMSMSAAIHARHQTERQRQGDHGGQGAQIKHHMQEPVRAALQPLPSAAPHALVKTTKSPSDSNMNQGTVPAGRFRVFLDFDPTIPVSALETLLGDGHGTFATRATKSGDRRVYFGAYDQRSAAKRRRDEIKQQTGLSPEISEVHA